MIPDMSNIIGLQPYLPCRHRKGQTWMIGARAFMR